jgi:hypothetical protein
MISAYAFEIVGEPMSADEARQHGKYLLEYDDGRRAIWYPGDAVEKSYMVTSASSIRRLELDDTPATLTPNDRDWCFVRPRLDEGRYLLIEGRALLTAVTPVRVTLEVDDRPLEPVPSPTIERIEPSEAPRSCSDHGLFVARLADQADRVWTYDWTVRDQQGRVVQEGLGPRPHALAQATKRKGVYEIKPLRNIGGTQRPFHAGQRYVMEVRAVDFAGRESAPVSQEFVFEQTAERDGWAGLGYLVLLMFGCLPFCGLAGIALLILGGVKFFRSLSDAESS